MRDHIYRTGLIMIEQQTTKKTRELLSCGNMGRQHLHDIQKLIPPTAKTPEFVARKYVEEYLEKSTS